MRAKKLEKYLGVKEIYLKLEGTNPYGHKYDRIAEVLVKDALMQGKKSILVDGSYEYIDSIMQFALKNDIYIKIPIFKNEKWKRSKYSEEEVINFTKRDIDNRIAFLEQYCFENNYYNGSNGFSNKHLSILALQKIGDEITEKLNGQISTVFTQLSYGYTVSSLYNGFVNRWVQGDIEKYPKIFSCTIPNGNIIFDDYKKNLHLNDLDKYDIKVNKYTRHLFIDQSLLLEETLKAIHDTNGNILSIDENLLKESSNVLRHLENVILSTEEGYSFAGFYKLAKEKKIQDGNHVIILNNGKSDIDIERIQSFDKYSIEQISSWIKEWLLQYSDSMQEISEAVESAKQDGFILIALRNNTPQGVCVVVNIGFESYIPTYHLSYIATKKGNKGRGIATKLINQVVELTGGKVSLHVDLDNKRAKKLYEKLGFKHMYNRMIYYGE